MATQGDGPRRRVNPKYLAVLAIVLFGSAALAGIYSFGMQSSGTTGSPSSSSSSSTAACAAAAPEVDQKLASTTFGAITEYTLPANRTPSGVAAAPDGSVWFGEWGLPGVAHLFPNGTVTEYKWPYPDSASISNCQMATQIWGVALWNGSVWGSDFLYSRLVGVNPSTGQDQKIDLANGTTPYTLAVSPNNYLWFTESKLGAAIGRVSPTNGTVDYYNLPTAKYWESVYVLFRNDTVGYVLALDGVDPEIAQIYSFNPSLSSPSFSPVGENQTLYAPTGLALGDGGIWATEHSASAMAFLNFTTDRWTIFPTSTVSYTPWVLTYFDGSNGSAVWFNEHYGNRMGVIYDNSTQLTEYNVSNPPLYNLTTITDPTNGVNMVTMGIAPHGAWFAAAGGFVGYVSGSYVPPFSISVASPSIQVSPGGSTQTSLKLTGAVEPKNVTLQFSDNEFNNGTAKYLVFTPGYSTASSGGGGSGETLLLNITAASGIQPGTYVAAATITNGSIYRSVYFTVTVT
jgi:virginiamycin B lyase